jgi:subtilisin family serine protease
VSPLDLVNLKPVMQLTSGRPEVAIGLIDGPVAIDHPDLVSNNLHAVSERLRGTCSIANSVACAHGTFVAGILCARRDSAAPAICPQCTLLVRPIFAETTTGNGQMPSASPKELAAAIIDTVNAGARLINLSAALIQPAAKGERQLVEALDRAAVRGVIVVVAAGNQGIVGSSVITRHPWVVPVVACNDRGQPLSYTNLGSSIGRQGLRAPGDSITSLGSDGQPLTLSGTSAAAPFVTGAIALLWSEFPNASAAQVRNAVTRHDSHRQVTVVPPLLDAWAAHQIMTNRGGQ